MAAQQHLQEGELRSAVRRAGEANGFRIARKMLADGESSWPTEDEAVTEAYADVAAAIDGADVAVEADAGSGDEDVGVW